MRLAGASCPAPPPLLLAVLWPCSLGLTGGTAGQATAAPGYVLTDPAAYDPALKAEDLFHQQLSDRECFCGGSRHQTLWASFHSELQSGLARDPAFGGEWVHRLCGIAYPVIFRIITVDPVDASFTLHSDCPAGLLAMVAVCAQSSALQARSRAGHVRDEGSAARSWRSTERVVRQEGRAVGAIFGPVPLDECLAACAREPGCRSLAHGPNGCHLKSRCVSADDPLVGKGDQGDDYRTYYLSPCPGEERSQAAAAAAGGSLGHDAGGKLEELRTMMGFVPSALEFCLHCLDASPWPFSLEEVMENYAIFTENPKAFLWSRGWAAAASAGSVVPSSSRLDPPAAPLPPLPPVRRLLLRARTRWTRGLEMEAEFWRKKLSLDPDENDSLERLQRWLATGQVNWFLDDDQICGFVRDAVGRRAASGEGAGPRSPRILNAGSGPFAPGPLECELPGAGLPGGAGVEPAAGQDRLQRKVPVVASDGLARFYNSVLDERGMTPPNTPLQCPSESLHSCFPLGHFDVVHMRNSLDHVFDPLLAITRMLQVARPGGWVLLRHARNEGVAGQFRNGLHQWAFDVEESAQSGAAFVIWSPELRVDVTAYLLETGLAADVRTALRAHPSPEENPDERYVWVEIRKPTAQEASDRLATQASEDPGLDDPRPSLG